MLAGLSADGMLDRIAQRLRCSRAEISEVSENFQAASAQPDSLLSSGATNSGTESGYVYAPIISGRGGINDMQTDTCSQYFVNVTK